MRVLFIPYHMGGHTNAMIGLAKELQKRGNQIIFFADQSKADLLTQNDFKIEFKDISSMGVKECDLAMWRKSASFVGKLKSLLNETIIWTKFGLYLLNFFYNINKQLAEVIPRVKPDVIILDDFQYPAVVYSGLPLVTFWSCNPKFSNRVYLGSVIHSIEDNLLENIDFYLNELFVSLNHKLMFFALGFGLGNPPRSPCLKFYLYPKEIDYKYSVKNLLNNYNLEASFRIDPDQHLNKKLEEGLENFIKLSKKLILVSFGHYVSSNTSFMRKVIAILSKSEHRFIVSKGVNHSSYELSKNMWGKDFISQRQILPYVDLVINHGGNNTFTESFFFGKPQIIIPFAFDQFDNALRIREFDLGIYIDRNELKNDNLLNAINYLLDNKTINQNLTKISTRMRQDNKLCKAIDLIENLK